MINRGRGGRNIQRDVEMVDKMKGWILPLLNVLAICIIIVIFMLLEK